MKASLLSAQPAAQLLEVEHRVGGRVEGASRADAAGALGHVAGQEGVERAQPLHLRAAQGVRPARPTQVEHDEPVAAQRRLER